MSPQHRVRCRASLSWPRRTPTQIRSLQGDNLHNILHSIIESFSYSDLYFYANLILGVISRYFFGRKNMKLAKKRFRFYGKRADLRIE